MTLLGYMESNRTIKQDDLAPHCRDDTAELQIFALLSVIWHFNEQLTVCSTVGSEHWRLIARAGDISLYLYQRLLLNFGQEGGVGE